MCGHAYSRRTLQHVIGFLEKGWNGKNVVGVGRLTEGKGSRQNSTHVRQKGLLGRGHI